jgi:hypothetical protein
VLWLFSAYGTRAWAASQPRHSRMRGSPGMGPQAEMRHKIIEYDNLLELSPIIIFKDKYILALNDKNTILHPLIYQMR